MSKKKVIVSTAPKVAPTVSRSKTASSAYQPKNNVLIFGRINYFLMLAGLGLIGLGLVLMSGGGMPDPNTWDESLIYNSRRTLVGPFVIILGLVVEIFAIFKDPGFKTVAEEQA